MSIERMKEMVNEARGLLLAVKYSKDGHLFWNDALAVALSALDSETVKYYPRVTQQNFEILNSIAEELGASPETEEE